MIDLVTGLFWAKEIITWSRYLYEGEKNSDFDILVDILLCIGLMLKYTVFAVIS